MLGDFPFCSGVGHSTGSEIKCDWCGKVHNKGIDVDKGHEEGESIRSIHFGGKEVAECCFEKLEKAVFVNRDQIIKWLSELSKIASEAAHHDEVTTRKGKNALEALGLTTRKIS